MDAISLSSSSMIALYREFGPDLVNLRQLDRSSRKTSGMYHEEERRTLYLMVRHYQPKIVVEFSPHKGWSTLHIARALEDNGAGHVFSFELYRENIAVAEQVLCRHDLAHRVHFYRGDVRHTLPAVVRRLGREIDFLFVDSNHSYDFGRWWLTNVLPDVRPGGLVHVHDVEYSHRYGWGALTLTHWGNGVYGPPKRRFIRSTSWQRAVWRGHRFNWVPRTLRKVLVPRSVQTALDHVHYSPGTSVADLSSSHGPGEALAVKEYLDTHPDVPWISVMDLVEDPDYCTAIAPYGGGKRVPHSDPWGYERSPTLYFLRIG